MGPVQTNSFLVGQIKIPSKAMAVLIVYWVAGRMIVSRAAKVLTSVSEARDMIVLIVVRQRSNRLDLMMELYVSSSI